MKKIKYFINTFILSLALFSGVSCVSLDIPPMNIVTDDAIMTSSAGIEAYMVRLYDLLPMEDFRYNKDGLKTLNFYTHMSCQTGESVSRDTHGSWTETFGYWDQAYKLIREANYFLENIDKYASTHNADDIDHWKGEAYFIRAYTYFALAKRYGGVPIVDHVIDYPASVTVEETRLSRDSEEATWDFISKDLDQAYSLLPDNSEKKGRVNKYAAAAFKSRAMLYAGSTAKYNSTDLTDDGKRLCGIPSNRANDYFNQAYEASKLVDAGGYELYKGEWSAEDKNAQYQNYVNIFLKDTKENIFVRYFTYPERCHSWDCYAQPIQTSNAGSNTEVNPTLDFVEMFDGFPKDKDGHFANLDENGNYKLFTNTMDAFANVEPRLRATVILPGDEFKGQTIEVRRGIYVGEVAGGIKPILPVGANGFYDWHPEIFDNVKLALTENDNNNPTFNITLADGTSMKRSGKNGMVGATLVGCCITGFGVRKYLDPKCTFTDWNRSETDWIEIRYAEVLLNRAEAAIELGNAAEAYKLVNQIRERAGADLLKSQSEVNIDVVRKERRKELAFESQTYWDLRRWRILDIEQNNRIYRCLQPFMASKAVKYFFDIKTQEQGVRYTYDTRMYYQPIPNGEIQKNPNMKQNPGF